MNFKVTLDYLDPNSDAKVLPSTEQVGHLTNVYKYISTMGHPASARGLLSVPTGDIIASYTKHGGNIDNIANPEVCAGGLVCFDTDIAGKSFFDHTSGLVGYGTRYSSDMTSISSKYGPKLINNTVLEPCHFRQVWEFAPNQALGNIKSIALTHQAGAHAIDNTDFTTDMTLSVGKDFSLLTDTQDSSHSAIDGATPMNAGCGGNQGIPFDHIRRFYSYNTSDSTTLKSTFYYQTEKYVFLCRVISINVQNDQGHYITTFRYKKIDKDDVNLYFDSSTPYPSFSKLSNENSDSDEYYCDGSFEIDSGTAQLRTVSGSAGGTNGRALGYYSVQDYSYLAFAAFYSASSFPSYDNGYSTSNVYAARIYFVSGDTPTVTMQDTVYKSPLGNNNSSANGLTNILFLHDKTFIVTRAYATNSRYYVYRAKVTNSELIWQLSLPSSAAWRASWLVDNKDYFLLVQPSVSGSGIALYRCQIRKISDGSIVGSCVYELPTGESSTNSTNAGALSAADTLMGLVNKLSTISRSPAYFMSTDDNPFIIVTKSGTLSTNGNNYAALLRTNYIFGYAVLPNAIAKTSAFRLRVTIDVYFN